MNPDDLAAHVDRLASFAVDHLHKPLPTEVDAFARTLLVDSVGALVGGLRYAPVARLAREVGGGDLAAEEPSFAAYLRLGSASTWLDADSGGSFHPQGHRMPPVPTAHPAPHVLPVLLSAAARGVTDRILLSAFTIGVEVGMRFGAGTTLRPGLHPHGIHGPIAAAVVGSLVAGHPADRTAGAMLGALSLPIAARLWQPMQGGTVRNVWTALGGYHGARAALGADPLPYSAADAAGALAAVVEPDVDTHILSDRLGDQWVFLDSYLKPYACARWIHPALDALGMIAAHSPSRAEVRRIEVDTFAYAASLAAVDVTSDLQARFSLPVCIATHLLDGQLHAAEFLPERLARSQVGDLARRVLLREDPTFSAALPGERPTTVTVTWVDGTQDTQHVRGARGNPADPLSTAEVVDKFRANTDGVLDNQFIKDLVGLTSEFGESWIGHGTTLRGLANSLA